MVKVPFFFYFKQSSTKQNEVESCEITDISKESAIGKPYKAVDETVLVYGQFCNIRQQIFCSISRACMHSLDFSDSVKFQLLIKDAGAMLF